MIQCGEERRGGEGFIREGKETYTFKYKSGDDSRFVSFVDLWTPL